MKEFTEILLCEGVLVHEESSGKEQGVDSMVGPSLVGREIVTMTPEIAKELLQEDEIKGGAIVGDEDEFGFRRLLLEEPFVEVYEARDPVLRGPAFVAGLPTDHPRGDPRYLRNERRQFEGIFGTYERAKGVPRLHILGPDLNEAIVVGIETGRLKINHDPYQRRGVFVRRVV